MKRTILSLFVMTMALTAMADDVMQKKGDTYIVNTTTLCHKKGYKSTTPVEVHIQNGKVIKVVALPNKESKGYFKIILQKLLPLYNDIKVGKAEKLSTQQQVDAYTGATFSGNAVQANIKAALDYYKAHK